jgi:hypothetical protein
MFDINQACITTGVGSTYGQLVVLGYTEYRMVNDHWFSFGHPNIKFQLSRRYSLSHPLKLLLTCCTHYAIWRAL